MWIFSAQTLMFSLSVPQGLWSTCSTSSVTAHIPRFAHRLQSSSPRWPQTSWSGQRSVWTDKSKIILVSFSSYRHLLNHFHRSLSVRCVWRWCVSSLACSWTPCETTPRQRCTYSRERTRTLNSSGMTTQGRKCPPLSGRWCSSMTWAQFDNVLNLTASLMRRLTTVFTFLKFSRHFKQQKDNPDVNWKVSADI